MHNGHKGSYISNVFKLNKNFSANKDKVNVIDQKTDIYKKYVIFCLFFFFFWKLSVFFLHRISIFYEARSKTLFSWDSHFRTRWKYVIFCYKPTFSYRYVIICESLLYLLFQYYGQMTKIIDRNFFFLQLRKIVYIGRRLICIIHVLNILQMCWLNNKTKNNRDWLAQLTNIILIIFRFKSHMCMCKQSVYLIQI